MPELFRYNNSFEPLLLEGYTVTLYGAGLPDIGKNVRCVGVGALPEYYNNFGAVTANVWLTDVQDTNLIMNTMEFSQLRMRVVDDVRLRLRNSAPVQQWRTRDTPFYLPQFPQTPGEDFLKEFLFKASEFFIWQDQSPMFEFFSSIGSARSGVLFSGWRFKIEEIQEKGRFSIWLSDWPSRTPR